MRPPDRPGPAAGLKPAPKAPLQSAPKLDETAAPAGAGTPRREPLRETALKDPSVKLFVDKLKGRMGMVEGAGPGKDKEE
jgi:hypothetical protein